MTYKCGVTALKGTLIEAFRSAPHPRNCQNHRSLSLSCLRRGHSITLTYILLDAIPHPTTRVLYGSWNDHFPASPVYNSLAAMTAQVANFRHFPERYLLAGGSPKCGGSSRLSNNHYLDAGLFGDNCPLLIGGPCRQSLAHSQRQTETIPQR